MKSIEKLISPLIESQFPSFYKEEGPQFIAFVKAYYQWMEQTGNPLNISRNLLTYKDIDTTLDDYILYFKEKYLKNIQFDTATDTIKLIKNSLTLYRSKGTERSIDLFFKLVYGTGARVGYPAEKIFRLSDGKYVVPNYIEISYSKYNVDYVGKQISGSLSGATAFVENYIRRKAGYGYVNILYVTNISGTFLKGEMLGINVNSSPVFDVTKRAAIIGSISSVVIVDKGRDFAIGDIVSFTNSNRGVGGLARVSATSEATGLVDFLFLSGGYGYTTTADSVVSEKVILAANVVANSTATQYYSLLENIVQPIANINFTSANGVLSLGENIYRYASNNLVGAGRIINLSQTGANGDITVSHVNGSFLQSGTFYTLGNTFSFSSNTIEDRTINAKVMGIPNTYTLTISSQVGELEVGENVYQNTSDTVIAYGILSSIIPTATGNTLNLSGAAGSFKSSLVLRSESNVAFSANISNIEHNLGVYEINKTTHRLKYSTANNANITDSNFIYQYNPSGNVTAKGLLITSTYTANSGNLTVYPLSGYFEDTLKIYTDSNTAQATLITYSANVEGGDFIASGNSRMFTVLGNTQLAPVTLSSGSGAEFEVGTIGETEVIFINTDIISSNNVDYLDIDRLNLTVSSNTGLEVGDYVYQEANKIAFNSSLRVNATSGFITLNAVSPNPNNRFANGEYIKYNVDSGNTVINGLTANDSYYVYFGNTTGVILSNPYDKTRPLNTAYDTNFANNLSSETGHYFYKENFGTVFELGSGLARTKDNHNLFGITTAGSNTSTYGNTNLILSDDNTTNTAITAITNYSYVSTANQQFFTLLIREAGYGFPKNPKGDAKDTIYSCLSFGRFEIGVIDSLAGLDPGSDYNIDPYILAYQQEIAAFNRKDLILTVENATSGFTVGEKINQIQANLSFYDLLVGGSVYGNTFTEVEIGVNALTESANSDFIYTPSTTIDFNRSVVVDDSLDFVSVSNNAFSNDDYLRYYTSTGNTAVTGLSNNGFYFVVSSNTSGFKVATTSNGASVNITSGANVQNFNSNTIIGGTDFILLTSANTYFANDAAVTYFTNASSAAVSGLANNEIYYIRFANSTGFALALTSGGANVDISAQNPGSTGHFVKYYNPDFNGNYFVKYSNPHSNNAQLLYTTATGNTVISGLSNAQVYFTVFANSVGFKVASTYGGANVNLTSGIDESGHYFSTIPGFLPIEKIYQTAVKTFNANTSVANTTEFITLSNNYFENGDVLVYTVSTGNTASLGLTSGDSYYVVNSNSSGIKLSLTVGGSAVNLTSGVTESGHNLTSTANGIIYSVSITGSNNIITVRDTENTFTNTVNIYSYTNLNITSNVSSVTLQSITSTAKGIVKSGSNSSVLFVKRITFENTFNEDINVVGDVSGASANVSGVSEDFNTRPIGLNAVIEANVVTANGQVTNLQIIDSGVAYSNSESVQFNSEDGLRSGTVRVVTGGRGIGKGYYTSTRGFLSEESYIHDSDYYQEYSYEIFSKLSLDKYKDMFKEVMHIAGTKFFGSAEIIESDSANASFSSLSTGEELSFNPSTKVSSANDTIDVGIATGNVQNFNSNTIDGATDFILLANASAYFANDDSVKYSTNASSAAVSGLANNEIYFLRYANSTGFALALTPGGANVDISAQNPGSNGHFIQYYNLDHPFANGDYVYYYTATGNTVLSGLANASYYYVINSNSSVSSNTLKLSATSSGNVINITSGLNETGHYLLKTVEES